MTRLSRIYGLFLATLMLLSAGSALAFSPLVPGFNTFEFINFENRITEGTGPIQAGDRFYGIANVQQIKDGNGVAYWFESAADHVQAYFYNEVASVTDLGNNLAQIIFKAATVSDPNGVFTDAELAAGATLKFYGSATALTFGSLAGSIASATDGTLLATMSLVETEGYWWANGVLDPTGFSPGTFVANSLFGLNVLGPSAYFASIVPINDPTESLFDYDVQLYAGSTVETNARTDSSNLIWTFTSDDPAVVNSVTPEPASMILLGSGLLGLFAIRRRKSAN